LKQRLSAIDWAFLQAETSSNLAHVAGLWILQLPEGYRGSFWRQFMRVLEVPQAVTEAFNCEVSGGLDLPSCVPDPDLHRLAKKRKFATWG